jgi:hypothetical protein
MRIIEGDLTFGDFHEADCFHIEKTDIYDVLSRKGIKSVEFILFRSKENELLFVEGKKSLPSKDSIIRFSEEISNISQKFMDSLQLACGIWFGGHNKEVEVPKNVRDFFKYGVQIVFILVIKNREKDLLTIAEKIKKHLLKERRLWKFEVLAMNEKKACEKKLVIMEGNP